MTNLIWSPPESNKPPQTQWGKHKKGNFENPKGISTVFSIVRFPGCAKTVLSEDRSS